MERKMPEQTKQGKPRGSTTHSHSHYHQQRPRRHSIPQETSSHLSKLRAQYQDQIIENRSFESSIFGYCEYDVYPDEYYEKELEILCGDMHPGEAADYLESVGLYSSALIKRLDTVRAFKYLKSIDDMPETREYAKKVITENPDTSIELEARIYLAEAIPWRKEFYAEKAEAYKQILEIIPNSINIIVGLGNVMLSDDKPIEAIAYFKQVNRLAPEASYSDLGRAYEKLGDVKTAWTYYKKALVNGPPQLWLVRQHIEAIEAGDPIYKPVQSVREPISIDTHEHEHTTEHHSPQDRTHHAEVLYDDPLWVERETVSPQDTRDDKDERRRAAAQAAQRTHEEFLKYQELSRKEFDDFLQWAETIMNAESPIDTNDFLTKELAAHLKGGKTEVSPERLVRAFELMERHGRTGGLQRLKEKDPELAAKVQRFLEEKQQSSRHSNSPNKNE